MRRVLWSRIGLVSVLALPTVLGCAAPADEESHALSSSALDSFGPIPQDASRVIERIFVPLEFRVQGRFDLVTQLERVPGRVGASFVVTPTANQDRWIRDPMILLKNRKVVVTRIVPNSFDRMTAFYDAAAILLQAKSKLGGTSALAGDTDILSERAELLRAMEIGEENVVETDLLLEGGNVLSGRRKDASSYVLVGYDSLVQSAALIHRRLGFSVDELHAAMQQLDDTGAALGPTIELLRKAAQLMRRDYGDPANPLSPSDAQVTKLLGPQNFASLGAIEARRVWRQVYQPNPLVPFNFDSLPVSGPVLPTQEFMARRYLAQLELTKQRIREALGNVPAGQIAFVPQPFYHLDVFLRPARMGEVFTQNPAEAIGKATGGGYSLRAIRDGLAEAEKAIRSLNVTVTRLDGALRLGDDPKHLPRNFLNGIMASTAPDCGSTYYITNSSGNKGDDGNFRKALKKIQIETVFIDGYSEDLYSGGVHCATLEHTTSAAAAP